MRATAPAFFHMAFVDGSQFFSCQRMVIAGMGIIGEAFENTAFSDIVRNETCAITLQSQAWLLRVIEAANSRAI